MALEIMFGMSKSTISKIIWRFIQALKLKGGPIHLAWPVGEKMEEVKRGMEAQQGLPNCCGAIDGTHLPIELPPGQNSMAYRDYKGKTSIAMQAIMDSNLRFLDVFAGWGGNIHDTRLLKRSRFFKEAEFHHTVLNGASFLSHANLPIREYIIGDGGYPIREWLLIPYRVALGRKQHFNYLLSSSRMCVERGFGRFKGLLRLFSKPIVRPKVERLGETVYAGCIFHNIMIDKKDPIDENLLENMSARPEGYSGVPNPNRSRSYLGEQTRDRIMEHLELGEHREDFAYAQQYDPPPRPSRRRRLHV